MAARTLDDATVRGFVPARRLCSRKGENGTVLVVGGSYLYHGAPILSSIAALRCGTDLVYTAVPRINVQSTRSASPDLIVVPLADQKLTRGAVRKLLGQIPKGLDSAAIGMGLAVQDTEALRILVRRLADSDVRMSLDASALVPDVLPLVSGSNSVLTPHAGEFGRLFGEPPPDELGPRAALVESMAERHRVTILLKGQTDVISDGSGTYTHGTKTPSMTVGGTGDVLSGLVAGMLAKNRDPLESAAAAAYVNGLAGYEAQRQCGMHITATDLCGKIPGVLMRFDRTVP